MPKGMYLSYADYKEAGGDLPESSFKITEFACRKKIDRLTSSRVRNMQAVPEAVKMCMLAMIPIEQNTSASSLAGKKTVTSYSTDGYSEHYGKAMTADDGKQAMTSLIKEYLDGEKDDLGVPLLYRGLVL